MDIRFVSSLTIEDENRLAPAVLQALAALLRAYPLAYTLRIETAAGEVFEHQQAPAPADESSPMRDPHPTSARRGAAIVTPFRY